MRTTTFCIFPLFSVFRGFHQEKDASSIGELKDINFQALIEGQDYESALHKIVSTIFHTRTCTYSRLIRVRIRTLKTSTIFLNVRSFQGFSSFHYTPLEVLLVIKQCQRGYKECLPRKRLKQEY